MKIRARAPLRLGLAGGGTDVSPYSDEYGGCVLNATINMYAHCTIELVDGSDEVVFEAKDAAKRISFNLNKSIIPEGELILHKAVYRRVMDMYNNGEMLPIRVTTFCDAPPGSGLGSSSTVVVSMLEAYRQLMALPLGEYDLAHLAYEIERMDCGLAGGKQDQYAATFGGFNFIEFYKDDRVIVNPLRMRRYIISELESSLILFFTGASRDSATIIEDQMNSLKNENKKALHAMHEVKQSAYKIKEMLLKADIEAVSREFRTSWEAKKATSRSISNNSIDVIEKAVLESGARSLKVSGAGGGGFMMIFVDPEFKPEIQNTLKQLPGQVFRFQFTNEGATSWTI